MKAKRARPRPQDQPPSLSLWRMGLVAAASLGLALGFYLFLAGIPAFDRTVSSATARMAGFALGILGAGVSVQGTLLVAKDVSFQVVADCTPLAPVALVAGAMLAFPSSRRAKLAGIAFSAVALSLVNLVRLVSLVYIGLYLPQWLEVSHLILWQAVMILTGIVLWLLWATRYALRSRP